MRVLTKKSKMAKISFAAWVGDVAGRVGNAVVQRGKAGNTLRERVIPINPESTAQVTVRGRLTARSKAWAGLTESQRNAWDSAAASAAWTQTDSFGNPFQLSGEQLYLKLNLVIASVGASAISSPPTKATFNDITLGALTATAGTPSLSLAFTGTLGGNDYLVVEASPQVSAGIMSSKSVSFKQIAEYQGASPANLLSDYTGFFGTLVAGNKIWLRVKQVNELTGEEVVRGTVSAIVGA